MHPTYVVWVSILGKAWKMTKSPVGDQPQLQRVLDGRRRRYRFGWLLAAWFLLLTLGTIGYRMFYNSRVPLSQQYRATPYAPAFSDEPGK